MSLRIECVHVGTEPSSRPFDSYLFDGDEFTANFGCRSSGQINGDRIKHDAATKCRCGTASAEKRLVDVVMKNFAKALSVLTTEISRQHFGKSITDRVWMADTFAFNDLDEVVGDVERRKH